MEGSEPEQLANRGLRVLGRSRHRPAYEAVTVPAYKMVGTSFPAIMPDPSGKLVACEIYTVDDATLARLDQSDRPMPLTQSAPTIKIPNGNRRHWGHPWPSPSK
jgi:gamma-glutamylcyclotransferase (GGCT)/AIG2-like uncharacterized protein YtfP